MVNKSVKCKECGKEVAKGSFCSSCGKDQRNFFSKHKFLTGFMGLALVVLIGIIGLVNGRGSKKITVDPSVKPITVASTTNQIAPTIDSNQKLIKINAYLLWDAYDANEVKADTLYKNKVILTGGYVEKIGVIMGTTYIIFKAKSELEVIRVECTFLDPVEIAKVGDLKKGDLVLLNGIVEGKVSNIMVTNCEIVMVNDTKMN